MKTFKKTYLPDQIIYNGEIYTCNNSLSCYMMLNKTRPAKVIETIKETGKKAVLVEVLSGNLKGKTDLHGQPYQPTKWIFTNKTNL